MLGRVGTRSRARAERAVDDDSGEDECAEPLVADELGHAGAAARVVDRAQLPGQVRARAAHRNKVVRNAHAWGATGQSNETT